MQLETILREAVDARASDILLSVGAPVTFQVDGVLEQPDPERLVTADDTRALADEMLDERQRQDFARNLEMELSYALAGVAHFRVSVYRQRSSVGLVMRVIPLEIPHYSTIGLTRELCLRLINLSNGLILVTGPTGAGKSTTIASFLEYLNTEHDRPRHIVTIEDPIEYVIESKTCVVDQRQVGLDTRSFQVGLRSALRQMPHVVFVGEMRDRETMEIALTAAETGNMVISTMATQSAAKTINRIVDVFPLNDQAEIRTRLALTLKGVISQILLPRADIAGRIAAREILMVNNSVANLIREGKIHQINNVMASSATEGMVLLDTALMSLHQEGIIETADALSRIQDPVKMQMLLS